MPTTAPVPKLNTDALTALGFTPQEILDLTAALVPAVNQLVEEEIIRALTLDDLKKLDKEPVDPAQPVPDKGINLVEKMYFSRTGKYLTDVAGEKTQLLVDTLAKAISSTRQKMDKIAQLPEDQREPILAAAEKKDWKAVASLLTAVKE